VLPEVTDAIPEQWQYRVANALGAIANLATHPDNQVAIWESGGIEKIVGILNSSGAALARERAANCLENLAFNRKCREKMMILGGTSGLVAVLLSSSNVDCVRAAVGALKNVCVDEESRVEIARVGGLKAFTQLLHLRPDRSIVVKAVECLGSFALEDSYRLDIREHGCTQKLLALLEPTVSDDTSLAVMGALLNLATDDRCKDEICRDRGIPKILSMLEPHTALTLRCITAMTLTNLTAQESCARTIAQAGGVKTLIQCLGKPPNDILREKAAGAMWNMSVVKDIQVQEEIRNNMGIPFLLSILEWSSFGPALENSLGALVCLSETSENRIVFAHPGAVNILIKLLDSNSAVVVEKAVGVLWNLCHEVSVQHTVRQLGGLKPLIRLLSREEEPVIQFNVAGALPLLTEQEENVHEVVEQGVVAPLVKLLTKEEAHVLLLQNCAQTLGNIAEGNMDYQSAVCHAKGLHRLADILAKWAPGEQAPDTNQQDLLAKCCYAVWLLCHGHACNQTTFGCNGIQGIIKVLESECEDYLLEMAAGVVCVLCEGSDENKDRLRAHSGLQPLIHLLEHQCDEVRLNVAKALCHLAENKENRRMIRELGGLQQLVQLLAAN